MISERSQAVAPAVRVKPSPFEWLVIVAALIVQAGAFLSIPLVVSGDSLRGIVNPFNTFAVAISLALIVLACAPHFRQVASLARRNPFSVAFIIIVISSTAWSIHPDITFRRSIGYVLTMLVAAYLCIRFDVDERMHALSWSFFIAAIASVVFVAAFPKFGIMEGTRLDGAWRGVFPHKNMLGSVMAAAVFTELFLLIRSNGRGKMNWAFLCIFLVLVAMSHSLTAWLLSLSYILGAALYLLWQRHRFAAVFVAMTCMFLFVAGVLVFWNDPSAMLLLVGKDPTLTGRTELWGIVVGLIRERPMLGWGYHAMWQVNDPATLYADKLTGNWGVTSSHNTFLEIALQLGLLGLCALLAVILVAFCGAVRACRAGILPLGWFCLMYLIGALLSGQVEETLGQNQVIEWVLFTAMSFGCGLELSALERLRSRSRRIPFRGRNGRRVASTVRIF